MDFGGGMAVGMGAGVGAGLAMGVSAGKSAGCEEIREYVQANALTIHDATGADIDIEAFLSNAVQDRASRSGGKLLLAILVLVGVAVCGILSYQIFL